MGLRRLPGLAEVQAGVQRPHRRIPPSSRSTTIGTTRSCRSSPPTRFTRAATSSWSSWRTSIRRAGARSRAVRTSITPPEGGIARDRSAALLQRPQPRQGAETRPLRPRAPRDAVVHDRVLARLVRPLRQPRRQALPRGRTRQLEHPRQRRRRPQFLHAHGGSNFETWNDDSGAASYDYGAAIGSAATCARSTSG